MTTDVSRSRAPLTFAALLGVTSFTAWQVIVGADAFWVVAMGRHIIDSRSIPSGVPFATADTAGWHNVPVLAELIFAVVTLPGDRGLLVLQGLLGAVALLVLALTGLRRGSTDRAVALGVVLVAAMSLQALVVVRLQMLSLVPFALLMVLLTREARRPTRAIWLLPVLTAAWSNLHGAVLVGVGVAGCYLLVGRLTARPLETIAVGASTLLSLLVTPAGVNTVHYYVGVFSNEAAKRGSELWSSPDPRRPFDAVLILGGMTFIGLFVRRRRSLWEYVVVGLLVGATVVAARNGVWLALGIFLFASRPTKPAAVRGPVDAPATRSVAMPLLAWATVGAAVWVAVLLVKDVVPGYVPEPVVSAVKELAGPDGVVLATEPGVEQLAADGLTVWVSDPIDAFAPHDQAIFLDFLAGDDPGRGALDHADVVAVEDGRAALSVVESAPGWQPRRVVGDWHLFVRTTPR